MEKQTILAQVIAGLEQELAVLQAAAEVAEENATGAEARAEGKYDTRALESAYLAEGQGRRIAEIRDALAAYRALELKSFAPGDPIALSALVEVEQRGARDLYFLGPQAGGLEVKVDGREVFVITPQSPLGRRVLGLAAGATLRLEGGREARVTAVS